MKIKIDNVSNIELAYAIEVTINGRNAERDRKLLHRKLIDGITYERLAEEFELSTNHTKYIVQCRIKAVLDFLQTCK